MQVQFARKPLEQSFYQLELEVERHMTRSAISISTVTHMEKLLEKAASFQKPSSLGGFVGPPLGRCLARRAYP
jgi:hypothetical protein